MKDLNKYTNNYVDGLTKAWLSGNDNKAKRAMTRLLKDVKNK